MCVYIDVYVNIYIYIYIRTQYRTCMHTSIYLQMATLHFSQTTGQRASLLLRCRDFKETRMTFGLSGSFHFPQSTALKLRTQKMLGASLQPCLLFHDMQKLVVGTNVTSIGAFNSVTKPRFHFYASENGVPGLVNIQKNMENHHFLAG